jgi:hypothetical protein
MIIVEDRIQPPPDWSLIFSLCRSIILIEIAYGWSWPFSSFFHFFCAMISSRQNNDDRISYSWEILFLLLVIVIPQASCMYKGDILLDCWYTTYLFNIYYSQAKIETMIYCVCDTSQEWTSDVWTISYVRLSNRNHRTRDVLIARKKKKKKKTYAYILNIVLFTHSYIISRDLLFFIHSLSLKENESLFRQLLMFLIISIS